MKYRQSHQYYQYMYNRYEMKKTAWILVNVIIWSFNYFALMALIDNIIYNVSLPIAI